MTNSEVIEMLEAEWRDRLKAAVLAEREACAKLAENRSLTDENKNKRIGHNHACKSIAIDIRARGQA